MKRLTTTYPFSINKQTILLFLIMCTYMMSIAQPTYISNTIFSTGLYIDFKLGDINQDGAIDLLISSGGKMYWLENDGNESFTTHLIIEDVEDANFDYGDINQDGAIDIVVTYFDGDNNKYINAWYENDGNENFTEHVIGNIAGRWAMISDLDDNGTPDVLIVEYLFNISGNRLFWLKNDGNENFTKKQITSGSDLGNLDIADIDHDGDKDIVSYEVGIFRKLVWLENDGNENFTRNTLNNPFAGNLTDTHVDDLNGDGLLDIVATSFSDGVLWYENEGAGSFTPVVIASDYSAYPISIYTLDWEGDGDNDLITSMYSGDLVVSIWENDGNENFTRNDILSNVLGQMVRPVDIDGDGDHDVFLNNNGDIDLITACSSNTDGDMDGFTSDCDCNDSNPNIYPGAPQDCNNKDNDCNGTVDEQEANFTDGVAPSQVLCNNPTVSLDNNGQYTFTGSDVFQSGTDACSAVSFVSASPSSVDCADIATPVQVTVIAQDASGNTASCMSTVTVEDNIPLAVNCIDKTVTADFFGRINASNLLFSISQVESGNCVIGIGLDMFPLIEDCSTIGEIPVTVTVTGSNFNEGLELTASCVSIITVLDVHPPNAACHDINVILDNNGKATITPEDIDGDIDDDDLWPSYDQCSAYDLDLSLDISSFDCNNLGVNPVVLTVTDPAGNIDNCTATVTVEEGTSLPPGWQSTDIGQAGMGNDYAYGPCSQVPEYTVTGGGNNTTGVTTDNVAFSSSYICGDGSIIAKVESVDPNGYGGLMIRESMDAGAKQVSVFSNMTNNLRFESRSTTNGMKQVNNFFKPSPIWLKLERQGDWVFAYYSTTGFNFQYVHAVYVPMQNCVSFGIASFTYMPGSQTEAVFSNVTITGDNGGFGSGNNDLISSGVKPLFNETEGEVGSTLNLFPNPNNGQFTVQMNKPTLKAGVITIYTHYGQAIQQLNIEAGFSQIELDLGQVPAGMYLLEYKDETAQQLVNKFMVTN